MTLQKKIALLLTLVLTGLNAMAQNSVTGTFTDASTGEAVGFATVSLTPAGAKKPSKYALTSDEGKVRIDGVAKGGYTLKAELLGYKAFVREITVPENNSLGVLKMRPDQRQLDAARVSAVGNAIIIKKDTIEYNATSFKTTDNDVLEDLLKKLPGVEVSEDGSITANGRTISKITIDGKTFFLDDPQLASKNIPAKAIEKLKVIEKKSDQAAFTGIDDGEEEHVIDLSLKPGMMKGAFGNVMAGGGIDIPSSDGVKPEGRYQGAAFAGKFTDKSQLSIVLNANNTNNRGFNDLSGSMMGNMRGGGRRMGSGQGGWGGQNGITTSYMGGVNGAWDLFGDKMDLGGNYLFNYTDKNVKESADKTTHMSDCDYFDTSNGTSSNKSLGHRFGVRLEHKFSENTSIIFEPQVNFGNGSFIDEDYTVQSKETRDNLVYETSKLNTGTNKNVSTSGFFLFRQRLGIPGRTLTAMARYSFSNNNLDGINKSNTKYYDGTEDLNQNQSEVKNAKSSSIMGRVTYTEPIGNNLYVEANYRMTYSKSSSDKETFDLNDSDHKQLLEYSNNIQNEHLNQQIGANLMYQKGKLRAQLGFAAQPTHTYNSTTKYDAKTQTYSPRTYVDDRWNFAPQAMVWGDLSETSNVRLFYRGRTSQPSTSQLMPVPDLSDVNNLSFGNPSLTPYFTHGLRGDYRMNNKKTFTSFNVNVEGELVKDPIVNVMWKDRSTQFTMPFNGPNSGNISVHTFLNSPIGKSNFSIFNMFRANFSQSTSYVGNNIDMTTYYDPDKGFYDFMEEFARNFHDPVYYAEHIKSNRTTTFGFSERFRMTYRIDALELQAGIRTRMNKSWYTISDNQTTTWNNQVRINANWTWDATGITIKSEYNFNWYRGYTTDQPSENVLNAEIQKLLFKKKFTLALKCYDIFGQSRNITVTNADTYTLQSSNNTLGRYIIMSLTWRFGKFDKSKMRGPGMGGPGGPGGRGPGMGGPGGRF